MATTDIVNNDFVVVRPPRWNRIRLTDELTYRLRGQKARTGLTPNLLCRLGFTLSLADEQVPNPDLYNENGQEFNRTTLFGEWDELFEVLLKQRLSEDGLDVTEHYLPQLRAHTNRGAEMVCNRLRDVGDIPALIRRERGLIQKQSNGEET